MKNFIKLYTVSLAMIASIAIGIYSCSKDLDVEKIKTVSKTPPDNQMQRIYTTDEIGSISGSTATITYSTTDLIDEFQRIADDASIHVTYTRVAIEPLIGTSTGYGLFAYNSDDSVKACAQLTQSGAKLYAGGEDTVVCEASSCDGCFPTSTSEGQLT